jgi:hypothetical protein
MKKCLAILMVLLLLTGCGTTMSDDDLQHDVEISIDKAVTANMSSSVNISKDLYKLYLATGLGRGEATETTNTFDLYGVTALLNLDVAAIISDSYYRTANDNGMALRDMDSLANPIFVKTGRFTNTQNKTILYQVAIKEMNDDVCYIMIQTNQFIFTALAAHEQVATTVYEMLKILRSCTVTTETVIARYANTEQTIYTKDTITLFDETLPDSGVIASYLDDWTNDPSFEIIDNTPVDDTDEPNPDDIGDIDDEEETPQGDETTDESNQQ